MCPIPRRSSLSTAQKESVAWSAECVAKRSKRRERALLRVRGPGGSRCPGDCAKERLQPTATFFPRVQTLRPIDAFSSAFRRSSVVFICFPRIASARTHKCSRSATCSSLAAVHFLWRIQLGLIASFMELCVWSLGLSCSCSLRRCPRPRPLHRPWPSVA